MKTNIELPDSTKSGEWVYIEDLRDEVFFEDFSERDILTEEIQEILQVKG
jgi:hypothetical protein